MMCKVPDNPPLLEMRGISKAFPGVQALENVWLKLEAG
jgi:ABC-type sugar transport system ATPase subunit